MNNKNYFVYINTNIKNKVLYTGVTNDLSKRNWQHKENNSKRSFTYRYVVDKLVYYETFDDIIAAIEREKQIKAGPRKKKIKLIESINPGWKDLFNDF